uniref:Uncharacterized protein n=1 Tax=Arundo donax TaxID=35708 RepID=A0A0A9SG72_ARUDO
MASTCFPINALVKLFFLPRSLKNTGTRD